MLDSKLKSKINKLWDKFWAGGLANPLTAIEQISYLIFIKRLEELDDDQLRRATARKEKFISVFDGTLGIDGKKIEKKNCRWSEWKHFPAEEMMKHVRDNVFPFIKSLNKNKQLTNLLQEAIFMIPKPSLLQEAVSILDELEIAPQNYDTLGDLYEYLLSELNTAGKAGQFRTPRHIIRMMVELTNPKLGEKVCDPACGTAGFLVNAYEYIRKTNTSNDIIEYAKDGAPHNLVGDKITNPKHWEILRNETFYGYDFDQTMARIATMNMMLHGIEQPNIDRIDTLSKGFEPKEEYDVILANPPFTGSIDVGDINDEFRLKTTKTELLFLELFHKLLIPGGKAAIVVPNGVLFGSSNAHKKIRMQIMEEGQLEAVISLPSGVFKPYSGVGTAILVFIKGGQTENVWFYEMKSDGYSLDDKRTFIDGKGDIPDIIKKYKTKEKSEQSVLVPFKKVKDNDYNLTMAQYVIHKREKIEYESPKKLINDSIKLTKEIEQGLSELKEMI
jgi:type I restriction enzyme M protein